MVFLTLCISGQAGLLAWSTLASVEGVTGYNKVYYFKGKYILLAGQGPSFWSSDNGVNFTANPNQYFAINYEAETFDDIMLIGGGGSIQYSTDGINFTTIYNTGIEERVRNFAKLGDTYFAGTDNGIYSSTTPTVADSWTAVSGNDDLPMAQFGEDKGISSLLAQDGKLVAAVDYAPPYVSTDNGASFTPMTSGLPATLNDQRTDKLVFDGEYIWGSIGNTRALYRTTFDSLVWELVDANANLDLLAADPMGGIYRYTTAIQKSIDGLTWTDVFDYSANNTGTSNRWLTFAGGTAYLGGTGNRVFYTPADELIAPGEFLFRSAYELGDGWWWSTEWGFFWAGAYPWIYNFYLEWTYIFGPNESGYYAWDPTFGWFFSGRNFFPYIYVFNNGEGYTIDKDTSYPNTLFEQSSGGKVGLELVGLLNVNFGDLSGKTVTFNDSIGSHTLAVNSFGNESDRGELTMSINGQSYLFNFVQLTYTEPLGMPQILLQAQSSTGNTVQVTLRYTSRSGGTTHYLGYSLGIVPPVTGGSGVQGTFTIE